MGVRVGMIDKVYFDIRLDEALCCDSLLIFYTTFPFPERAFFTFTLFLFLLCKTLLPFGTHDNTEMVTRTNSITNM